MVDHVRSVVEEVMGEVVAYVSKYPATIDSRRCVPIVEKDCVRKLPERGCEYNE